MDVASVGVGALVIYGIVGQVKNYVPQLASYAFLLNFALCVAFGYLGLFGIVGIENGILASLSSTGANAFLNKMKQ